MTALEVAFWVSAGSIVHTHALYPVAISALARLRPRPPLTSDWEPTVTLIITAHDEESVIGRRVQNALALDYPAGRLEIIVASDGSTDDTVQQARLAANGDARVRVLDLSRAGKVATQNAAVEEGTGEVLAFSDANAFWQPGALRELVAPLSDPDVGYVCGELGFDDAEGDNQEGVYWRLELATRRAESTVGSITAGNGAIYALRREAYVPLEGRLGHDLALPFNVVRRGRRAVTAPGARAREKAVPDIGGEFRRKRRMMGRTWLIVLRGGMLDPRGYGPLYAFEIYSHRVLRYLTPFAHALVLAANVALVAAGAGTLYVVTLALQGSLVVAALASPLLRARPFHLARYYVLITAAPALGLWDALRGGVPATWEKPPGTR